MVRLLLLSATLLSGSLGLSACDGAPAEPPPPPPPTEDVVAGVDLGRLLAPPTAEEVEIVQATWDDRASLSRPTDYAVVAEEAGPDATVHVVSFGARGLGPHAEGRTFFGAVRVPEGAPGRLPVLAVLPAGTDGVSPLDFLTAGAYASLGAHTVQVLLAPPGEALRVGDQPYGSASAGNEGIYDVEVDLVRLLLRAVLAAEPRADAGRVAAVGFGRGATNALLLAERPGAPALGAVAALAGFTDYAAPPFREVVRALLLGTPTPFPGAPALAQAVTAPLQDGRLPLADARLALLRRSPVYFTDALPPLFLRHGTSDAVVPVAYAERLLGRLGAEDVDYEPVSGVSHAGLFSRPEVQEALARFLEDRLR